MTVNPGIGNGFTSASGALAVTVLALVASLSLLAAETFRSDVGPLVYAVWVSLSWLPPTLAALMLRSANDRRAWRVIVCCLPVVAVLAGYTAWATDLGALEPGDHSDNVANWTLGAHLWIVGVALFLLCPYLQRWRDGAGRTYAALHAFAWDNALTLVIAGVLTGAAWLILWLCGALFALIGIDLFVNLFTWRWFHYPVTGLFVGLGIALARGHPGAMQSLLRVCLTLGQLLLPLLALVALIFLPALLITGLTPLWETRRATPLLLTLVLGLVALTNSVFHDGQPSSTYGKPLRALVVAALLTLPVYALISVYALTLRVNQYGWTVERLWAALIVAFALAYAVGYAIAALRRAPVWLQGVAPTNAALAFVAALTLLLTQSPLFDPRGISAASQLARVERAQITIEQLDLRYFRWELGRHGRRALLSLRDNGQLDADTVERVMNQSNRYSPFDDGAPVDLDALPVLPEPAPLPDGLRAFFTHEDVPFDLRHALGRCAIEPCQMWAVDLDLDQIDEWVLMSCDTHGWPVMGVVEGVWRIRARISLTGDCRAAASAVQAGKVTLQPPLWQSIVIDGAPQHLQHGDLLDR